MAAIGNTKPAWDQRVFDSTLKEYLEWTKRDLPTVLNTKAFYIARKATWFTAKALPSRIRSALGEIITVQKVNAKGRSVTTKKVFATSIRHRETRESVPMAALLIHKRLAEAGKRSPFYGKSWRAGGAAMTKAIRTLIGARLRSIAFLKSGWLPAIKALEPYADRGRKPPIDTEAKTIGRPKGRAKVATAGWRPIVEILNLATTRRDMKRALLRYGAPGLQRAFNDEAASMREYIERKMKIRADKFNAQQRKTAKLAP